MKYWITYYQFMGSGNEGDQHKIISEHPLIWLRNQPQPSSVYESRPMLKDWKEIPDEVAEEVELVDIFTHPWETCPARKAVSRKNGAKGGRPKKVKDAANTNA